MEEISALAAAEAIVILNSTEISLVSKIPYIILKILEDKAKEYREQIEIDVNLQLKDQKISDEAQTILSTIYENYFCDKEKQIEMNKMLEEKVNEYKKYEAARWNPFKDSNYEKIESESLKNKLNNEEFSNKINLIESNNKWYIKLFNKIISFFKKDIK